MIETFHHVTNSHPKWDHDNISFKEILKYELNVKLSASKYVRNGSSLKISAFEM